MKPTITIKTNMGRTVELFPRDYKVCFDYCLRTYERKAWIERTDDFKQETWVRFDGQFCKLGKGMFVSELEYYGERGEKQ